MTDSKARPQGWVPNVETFGARLALVRQHMGWTNIKEAAEACAIAPQTWRQWESDKFVPRQLINACMKIAGVTGVDYRWLALGPAEQVPAASRDLTGVTAQYRESQTAITREYPGKSPAREGRVVAAIPIAPGSAVRTNVRYGVRATPLRG